MNASNPEELNVKWTDFPNDFVFGVSTAAAQIEGSAKEAGKGPSVWDKFVEIPGIYWGRYSYTFANNNFMMAVFYQLLFPFDSERIMDKSNMFTSIDSYKRYKEDVKLVKDLGVDSYRFSIPWTRILPNGTLSGGVNQEGVDHYNCLIDELIKNGKNLTLLGILSFTNLQSFHIEIYIGNVSNAGITPYVTLLHFDPPQALTDKYDGVLNRSFVNDFKDYSELCFKTYGDRVKNWITINEPLVMAKMGYDLAVAPPGRCSVQLPKSKIGCEVGNSSTEPYIVTHNLILSHATVVKLYRENFQAKQGGQIGWSHVGQYVEPYSDTEEDKAAAKRILDFELGWFMEPIVFGDYPKIMRDLVKERLPLFTEEEKKLIKGSFDFIGINYYTTRYGKNVPASQAEPLSYHNDALATSTETNANGVLIGPLVRELANGSVYIFSYPQGLQKLLEFMKQNYQSPKIYISENGITEEKDDNLELDVAVKDPHRIECILRHLYRIKMAMKNGVNVKGYFHWTPFDDFEWGEGYLPRSGLYYVDYKDNLKRIPKESAKWLPNFLKG
ncbi:putative beta-glucosidase [Rosa chinensis]|uniref:Putative beta-glucosidase n=1 Tax=Rosa chinensis TaxID=74649 RepID=A0A2P6P516_ROSCH|nr:putative beta-glucosidase [Rosa chinensis]